ncbi:MAG: retention module-containing protein, partial [Cycloclasticus sp.]|nr:retention module-containing protein [Cycloclasticus sp.]MBQ0790036.1 retention module-containing protein [Cycloclasticus sp.]
MADEIGIIKTLIGTVLALDGAGSSRKLLAGDRVFSDELIKTAAFAVVEIEFADGSTMDLGSNSLTSLGEMAALASNKSNEQDPINGVETLQQAIAEGADPTVIAEAPAAGTQSSENEGHNMVSIDYLAPEMTPDSGFETKGIERDRFEFDDEEYVGESDSLPTDVNEAPTAANDIARTDEDVPVTLDVVANDTDLDGTIDPTSVQILDPDTNTYVATLTVAGEGEWTVDAVTGAITFTPEANYNGSVTDITYQVADDDGATDTATLTIGITPVDDATTGGTGAGGTDGDESVTTDEDTPISGNVIDMGLTSVDGGPIVVTQFTVAGDLTV